MDPFGGWFTWAVISTIFYGIHSFLYQKLIKDRGDPLTAQVMQPATVTCSRCCCSCRRANRWPTAMRSRSC